MQENPAAQLLSTVLKDPGRPRITWYGADGERVELSGAVLANWVAKTANLLVEELDAGPGSRVRLDLPAHWRTIVWALAAWYVGATVHLDGAPAQISVTDRPAAEGAADTVVAVALPALARRFDATLPIGTIDYAATVLGYADTPPPAAPGAPGAPVLVGPTGRPSGALLSTRGETTPVRRLIQSSTALEELLAATHTTLAGDGSVVIVDHVPADRLAALALSERVDAQHERA